MADANAVPILDFSVLSDDPRPADPKPGVIETVWKFEGEVGGEWQRGEELGEVRIQESANKRFTADFTFDNDPVTVTVTGPVPHTGGRPWKGKAKAKAKSHGREKDKSDGREKDVPIESRNPKKWG